MTRRKRARKIKQIILGVAALALVVGVLLYRGEQALVMDEGDDTVTGSGAAATPVPSVADGDLSWTYPPGWVDYSDLPDKETLGDEDQPGLSNWRYLLVNPLDQKNYLLKTYYPDMEEVENGYYFQKRASEYLQAFLAAARAEGFTVNIGRTYLSYADQRVRFNGLASTLYDQGGITLAQAEEKVKPEAYFPGADEHQTGLAVHFVGEGGEAKFSTPVLLWMKEHCAEYGFILRYPEGKSSVTGREAEAGHFRYVGDVAAEYIMRKGITLEEFLAAYQGDMNEVKAW